MRVCAIFSSQREKSLVRCSISRRENWWKCVCVLVGPTDCVARSIYKWQVTSSLFFIQNRKPCKSISIFSNAFACYLAQNIFDVQFIGSLTAITQTQRRIKTNQCANPCSSADKNDFWWAICFEWPLFWITCYYLATQHVTWPHRPPLSPHILFFGSVSAHEYPVSTVYVFCNFPFFALFRIFEYTISI